MISSELPSTAVLISTVGVAALAGLARGFSGFGGALIFIPLASATVGPQIAAPLLMLVDGLTTSAMAPAAWRGADRKDVAGVAAGAIVGTPAGTWLLLHADPVTLRWAICLLAGLMLLLLVSGRRYRGKPRLLPSLAVGTVSGFCSGAAQIGGPPVVAYWLGGTSKPARARSNIVLFFAASGLFSAAAYLIVGLLTGTVLVLAAIVAPTYGFGLWCGSRLFGRASETAFRRICFVLIACAAVLGLPVWHSSTAVMPRLSGLHAAAK